MTPIDKLAALVAQLPKLWAARQYMRLAPALLDVVRAANNSLVREHQYRRLELSEAMSRLDAAISTELGDEK